MSTITHPIAIGAFIKGTKPSCSCKGAKQLPVQGKVMKVIKNHQGHWYYLDTGSTVKDEWVLAVV